MSLSAHDVISFLGTCTPWGKRSRWIRRTTKDKEDKEEKEEEVGERFHDYKRESLVATKGSMIIIAEAL